MTDRVVTVPDSLELPEDVKVPSARLSDSTAAGRALLDAADAAAQRTALGLGTAATTPATDYATAAQGAKADAGDVAQITLTGNLALTIPEGHPAGQVYRCAITQTTGGHTVTYDDQPVSVDMTTGASTTVELHPVGSGYVVRYPVAAGTYATAAQGAKADSTLTVGSVSLDPDEAIAPWGTTPISITTYTGGTNELVHPSVLFFADGWHGYRYWMAYTPYDNSNVQLENPCIAVSADGNTWVTPPGLTNPVEPWPGGAYLADTNIFMTPDHVTMCLVFKESRDLTTKITWLRTSTDGITWTPKVELFRNTWEDVSPAVLWDGSQYVMWTVKHADTPNSIQRRTSPTPAGPWSAPTACTLDIPSGQEPWHIDVCRIGGQYLMVVFFEDGGNGPIFGVSGDGLAWAYSTRPLFKRGFMGQGTFYKGCVVPKMTNGGLSLDLWYGGYGTVAYRIYRTTITFDREQIRSKVAADISSAVNKLAYYAVVDTFNRPDTTAGLGTADTGQSWTSTLGNVMGIVSGKAYLPVAANSRSLLDAGVSNYSIGLTTTTDTPGYLMFRYVDASNWWRFGVAGGGIMNLQKSVAGAITSFAEANLMRCYVNDRWEINCTANRITIYINGLPVIRLTDAANNTGTKIGLNIDNTSTRFDNLSLRAL